MRFLSVCSGIEAASVAWNPLGWKAAAFSEIEPFPCAVLKHHYPEVPNLGDMTKFEEWNLGAIDLLCGGTPCQSFSVAGLRKGLADPRGNLMLTFGAIADKFRPRWLVWENVPGVLSSNGGRDFGAFLGMLGQLGYGFAYRVFDAQYFGVAQRRRRVFVVGCLGDWRAAAAVLFERHSLQGHPAPSREAEEIAAALTATGVGTCGADDNQAQARHLIPSVTGAITSNAFSGGAGGRPEGAAVGHFIPTTAQCLTTGTGQRYDPETETILPIAFPARLSATQHASTANLSPSLCAANPTAVAAFKGGQGSAAGGIGYSENTAPTLTAGDSGTNRTPALMQGTAVRRLTPRECERLQGFPDDYTAIPWRGKPADQCPDGPRYKALGNSWAVPNVRWIGERIAAVDQITRLKEAA